ncbi:MAG: SEC-C domain-containing protein [Actinomycetia bacterium]|nr:SEC-C domain-containing protein [Actinomycetes bacterium]
MDTGSPATQAALRDWFERLAESLDPEIAVWRNDIESFQPFEDQRLEFLLDEDIFDVVLGTTDLQTERMRATETLELEEDLVLTAEDMGIADVEEELSAGDGLARDADLARRFSRAVSERLSSRGSPARKSPPVGRNDPCPCGSGKKYKKCCLPPDETAAGDRGVPF